MVLVATQVKRRRGTTAENDAFTGAEGEITVDTEKHELRVHDGMTQGGFKVGSGTGALIIGQIIEVVGTADYAPVGCLLADGAEYTKAQFPDLWADFLTGTPKLQTCTYTEYANQIAEYGFCNKFAVDTTNETFKVPTRNKYRKLVKKIVNGTSWANIYDDGWVEQGGVVPMTSPYGLKTVVFPVAMSSTNFTVSFSVQQTSNNTANITYRQGSFWNLTTTSFDCYDDDLIAKHWKVSGYTTIPDSTSNITREFVVVANGTLNQEQMDWSAWASSLAGRATTDMSNITSTGKETVVGWGMPDVESGIEIPFDSSMDYVAPCDGFIHFKGNTIAADLYSPSGVNLKAEYWISVNYSANMTPIPKGFRCKYRSGSSQYSTVVFYPAKGGNNA